MENIQIKPANTEYFDKLLSFADKVSSLCRDNGIQPVAYGSLAYMFYTQDESMAINDIDFLVKEDDFAKIMELVKTIPETTCEPTDYHSVKFFKNECKVAFDGIEHYLKGIDPQLINVKINDMEFAIVDKETLKHVYEQGAENIPAKKEVYSYKLKELQSL